MKRPLVAVRRATRFDRQRLEHPLFWPLERAARMLVGLDDFPPVEALGQVFDGEAPVRFVPMPPRRRRGLPLDHRALYDARIDIEGEVPTRPRCWHDLMNALVWGTFPLAKRALHARQHRALRASLPPGARALPPARTPELDALAIFDEGGVIVTSDDGAGRAAGPRVVVFGHAVYESLALGVSPAVVAAVDLPLRVDGTPSGLAEVDRALAGMIGDAGRLRAPSELRRVSLSADGAASLGHFAPAPSEHGS